MSILSRFFKSAAAKKVGDTAFMGASLSMSDIPPGTQVKVVSREWAGDTFKYLVESADGTQQEVMQWYLVDNPPKYQPEDWVNLEGFDKSYRIINVYRAEDQHWIYKVFASDGTDREFSMYEFDMEPGEEPGVAAPVVTGEDDLVVQ